MAREGGWAVASERPLGREVRVRAVIRRLHSPDIHDLRAYEPVQADTFGFLLQVLVGPDNGPGEESFDVYVCTPKWLITRYNEGDIIVGTHMLIVFRYDYQQLHEFVEQRVRNAVGATWLDVARQLALFGKWEFQDYVPV